MVENFYLPNMKGDLNIVKIIGYIRFKYYYEKAWKKKKKEQITEHQEGRKKETLRKKEKFEPKNIHITWKFLSEEQQEGNLYNLSRLGGMGEERKFTQTRREQTEAEEAKKFKMGSRPMKI